MKTDKTPKSILPIAEYILPFLNYCEIEKGLSNNTQRNYKQYLALFVGWLEKNHNMDLLPHELTANHVWDYRLYLARIYKTHTGGYLGKKSQNYYLIALRALLDFLADRDIETLPSSKIKLAKQKTDETISFLDTHDIEAMLKIPDIKTSIGLRDRTIMELFFSSGMRISELVALNVNKISFLKDKTPNRTFELSIVGKGRHVRTVFISPRSAEWLRTYLASRKDIQNPLFINYRGKDIDVDHRLTPRSIQKMISRCAMLAGISKKVTPHTLRHTYATDLLGNGADLRSVQELLGHKNVSTTQIYTHVTNKGLRDIHEKFHGGKGISNK
ncbi:MAG TPA: tyrosine-type recombinase/integrase [Candidatus Paceibacterota bacterium]|jgi:site-specific recombinase XerD|nr:tyrosine-type recombinase/integrase [Candidatus Paceibacterota bacterium]